MTHANLSALVGAAQAMLLCVLSEELADTLVRNEAIVCPGISLRSLTRPGNVSPAVVKIAHIVNP